MKVICNQYLHCQKTYGFCGGAVPHNECSECGNCPVNTLSKCEAVNKVDWAVMEDFMCNRYTLNYKYQISPAVPVKAVTN